ncbi:hypothetical protein Misp03_36760 [Microbispora sp. NBRC 16548]|nr:hypothetical protein Misp03_36760 [Microbispora sp. NBRC 16548]
MTPPVPVPLHERPTWHGLVVPIITLRHRNGTPIFGEVDSAQVEACLQNRLCQLCGRPLTGTAVLMAKPQDFMVAYVGEPAQHPWCAAYSRQACPMLSGRLEKYRRTQRSSRHCGDPLCVCLRWTQTSPDAIFRAGRDADPWFSVHFSMDDYQLRMSARHGPKGISLRQIARPKVRLVTPGRPSTEDLSIIVALGLSWN